jgi:hypothetical protein
MRSKSIPDWAVAILINLISDVVLVVLAWFLQEPLLGALLGLAILLCTIVVLLFLRIEDIRKKIQFEQDTSAESAQCCELHRAGFSQMFIKAADTLRLTTELASVSYRFLGVSGEFVIGTDSAATEIRQVVRNKALQGCLFQFILLDPEADDALRRHAAQEGGVPRAISLQIEQSIEYLKDLALECNGKLQVFLHSELPIFRVILINDESAFISFYGANGERGIDTPQLVFSKAPGSFFAPFSDVYEETIRASRQLI